MRKQTAELIEELKKENIDIYIISDMDDHLSEYTGKHFHALKEFSGFTGGDGKMVVTASEKALLWTDGRYFIQAEEELRGSGIELMRMGEPEVPALNDWVKDNLRAGGTIGFDGKCVSYKYGKAFETLIKNNADGGHIISDDICGRLWKERPAESCTKCWILDERFTGKSASLKLTELRTEMEKSAADYHIIASLDDIAWLLNMRADDIPCNPVFSAFMLITKAEARLYIDKRHFADNAIADSAEDNAYKLPGPSADEDYLRGIGVDVYPYEQIYEDIKKINNKVLLDTDRCSYEILSSVPEGIEIIDRMNPVTREKCRKNPVETANLRIAQHKDSIALTKFMYWFKKQLGIEAVFDAKELDKLSNAESGLSEWDCVEKLHEYRKEQPGFIEESFSTISAYGANAAMAHYTPSPLPEKTVRIKPHGLYLVDSGGQYPEGTTDVTRTWSCGALTDEERLSFTLTAIANLRLADERFLEGASGLLIDGAARDVFWRHGLNYNHGTGHGVGFCLNVHEAPVGIRYKAATIDGAYPMLEGMYVSDEPGMYVAGKYGIRIENLLIVKNDYTNEYGRFMSFETMNFCPIDKSCLDISIMEKRDIELLNAYHKRVYEELKDDMNEEELIWLKNMCSAI